MIVLLRGLPGSGKSALAQSLAPRIHAVILNKDLVRAALFPGETTEYTTAQDDFVIGLMLQATQYHLERNRNVILDGRTHGRAAQVELVRGFAARIGAKCLVVECLCRPETALRRIEADLAAGTHPAKNRDAALLRDQLARWETIEGWVCQVDGEGPLQQAVNTVAQHVLIGEDHAR
ncbi:MAG: ATP-binding protein [Acidobacteria bacterium]|nr:ATP-binding protein [Acidobacteriota bacterium]